MALKAYKPKISFIKFLKPFAGWIALITSLGVLANVLNLIIPNLTAGLIDELKNTGSFNISLTLTQFIILAILILTISIFQILLASFASERVAALLRKKLVQKISEQDVGFVNHISAARLLTNLTSDIDAVKGFISQGFAVIIAAIFLTFGATFALFSINARLAVAVLIPFPIIIAAFLIVFRSLTKLFKKGQEVIDKLNSKISETIFGASLVRVLSSQRTEQEKFDFIAQEAKDVNSRILKDFGMLLPIVNLIFNLMIVSIIYFGGLGVIGGSLSIGEFQAFYQYAGLLITPIFILGFVSGIISRSISSYNRIAEVLESEIYQDNEKEKLKIDVVGNFEFKDVSLKFGEKEVLKNVGFKINAGQKVAIIGPTGAGKSLLVNILLGLEKNFSGEVLVERKKILEVDQKAFFSKVSVVFQDSIIFNTTIRENITLGDSFSNEEIMKAVEIADLSDIVKTEADLERVISERGASLSGGQKQRLTLARAVVRKPCVLILDDFTARVDIGTERRITQNILKSFDNITLISVTQKIEPVKHFDKILLLMEGELIGDGIHQQLLTESFEYRQIYESQRSVE